MGDQITLENKCVQITLPLPGDFVCVTDIQISCLTGVTNKYHLTVMIEFSEHEKLLLKLQNDGLHQPL